MLNHLKKKENSELIIQKFHNNNHKNNQVKKIRYNFKINLNSNSNINDFKSWILFKEIPNYILKLNKYLI